MHVDDYDASTINVSKFQFPLSAIDHSPSLDYDVDTFDFEASLDAIDYDFPFGDFNAKFWFLDTNDFELNNVNEKGHKANKHTKL